MRRFLKPCAWVATTTVTLLAITLVTTLAPVDLTPHFRTTYAATTRARLANTTLPTAQPATLRAGFGRASLIPPSAPSQSGQPSFPTVPLAGYGDRRGRPATGTQDPIFARAVALETAGQRVVFLAAETLIVPREIALEVQQQLLQSHQLPAAAIYLGATHTHCSLGGWGQGFVARQFAGDFLPGLPEWIAGQLTAAARQALADLAPATLGRGAFAAPDLVRNRLVGDLGFTDPEFSYLLVRQDSGRTGIIGAFAAHATVLSSDTMQFSGDYPGAWSRALEESGFTVAAFFAGAVGSHSPVPPKRGYDGAQAMGRDLASRVQSKLAEVKGTSQVTLTCLDLPVDLPEPQWRVADNIRLRPWVSRRLMPPRPGADATWLRAVRLNDALWLGAPCDFSGELARPLRAELRELGFHATFTSFNGDYIGYVIPGCYYHLPGYEPRVMSFYGPTVPDYFQELIRRMASRLTNSPAPGTSSSAGSAQEPWATRPQ